jgi:hypothetical protein
LKATNTKTERMRKPGKERKERKYVTQRDKNKGSKLEKNKER